MNEPRLSVGFLTLRTDKHILIKRTENGARIELGDQFSMNVDMETLRVMCNGFAEVLDEWYDERDRKGKA